MSKYGLKRGVRGSDARHTTHGTVLSQHQARDRETSKLYEAAAI